MTRTKRFFASILATLALAASFAVPSASAQQVGLINLEVTVVTGDILSDNVVTVQVPISAAANICGVQVGVIAALGQDVECVARSGNATAQQ